MKVCPICTKEFDEHGHNPWPITSMIQSYVGGECCDSCNRDIVNPARQLMEPFDSIIAKVVEVRGLAAPIMMKDRK